MKYNITFSCGHTEERELFGPYKDRDRKIEYFENHGLCSACYHKQQEAELAKDYDEVEMSYRDYKNNYSDCKTKYDSYNASTKTIVVYVPNDLKQAEIDAENEKLRAMSTLKFGTKTRTCTVVFNMDEDTYKERTGKFVTAGVLYGQRWHAIFENTECKDGIYQLDDEKEFDDFVNDFKVWKKGEVIKDLQDWGVNSLHGEYPDYCDRSKTTITITNNDVAN